MNCEIIPDNELNLHSMVESEKPVYSDSESRIFLRTPWTWYLISGEIPSKTPDFFINAGYSAIAETLPLDNTLRNALRKKELKNISLDDLNIAGKIAKLNKLVDLLNIPRLKISGSNAQDVFYATKRAGFALADHCLNEIIREDAYLFQPKVTCETENKYIDFFHYTICAWADLGFVKGSYVDYIESGKAGKIPSDIDLGMVLSMHQNDYYEIMDSYDEDSNVDGIPINPILIPFGDHQAHSFFDLDINEQTKIFYQDKESCKEILLSKHPEKIIRAMGNEKLEVLRNYISNKEKIEFCRDNCEGKIISALRQPQLFYKQLTAYNLQHLAEPPINLRAHFNKQSSVESIQILLAETSLELSKMNQKLHNYIDNR